MLLLLLLLLMVVVVVVLLLLGALLLLLLLLLASRLTGTRARASCNFCLAISSCGGAGRGRSEGALTEGGGGAHHVCEQSLMLGMQMAGFWVCVQACSCLG